MSGSGGAFGSRFFHDVPGALARGAEMASVVAALRPDPEERIGGAAAASGAALSPDDREGGGGDSGRGLEASTGTRVSGMVISSEGEIGTGTLACAGVASVYGLVGSSGAARGARGAEASAPGGSGAGRPGTVYGAIRVGSSSPPPKGTVAPASGSRWA